MWNSFSNIGFYENLLKEKTSITKNVINFKKICRTCLRDAPDENNLLQIFEIGAMTIKNENDKDIRLIDMITSTTGLIINGNPNDDDDDNNLPLQICNNCIQNVSNAYFFKIQSQQANETLNKICYALSCNRNEVKSNLNILQVSIPFETLRDDTNIFVENEDYDKKISFEKMETIETTTGDLLDERIDEELETKNLQVIEIEYEEIIYDSHNNLIDEEPLVKNELQEYQRLQNEIELNNQEEYQTLENEIQPNNDNIDSEPENSRTGSTFNKSCVRNSIQNNEEEYQRLENKEADPLNHENIDSESYTELENSQTDSTFVKSSIKNSTKSSKLNIRCSECFEQFSTNKRLIDHVRTVHPNVKAFECETCHQKFLLHQTLKRHQKIHQANQKDKYCNFCRKSFTRNDDLKRHVRTHTNERPYLCTFCTKSYKQSSELKEHLLIHTENRQIFTCTICSKTLLSRNGMYVHMKVHANIRNHKCKKCNKEFVTSGELTSHIRHIHTERERYLCEICRIYFNTIKTLKSHWNRRHNENISGKLIDVNTENSSDINSKRNKNLNDNSCGGGADYSNENGAIANNLEKIKHLLVNNENDIEMVECGELENFLDS